MQKKEQFDQMCSYLRKSLEPFTQVSFALQTNAMLIDQEWIDLFEKHQIGIGVSLDGPKIYNDLQRVDHRGRGTYDRVVNGIKQLNSAEKQGRILKPGLICVIDPRYNSKKIYRHFVDDLNITNMNFLLPDFTHDTIKDAIITEYGKYLCNLFDEWTQDDNPNIKIRFFCSLISLLNKQNLEIKSIHPHKNDKAIFVIASNGDLVPDDTLRTTHIWKRHDEINGYRYYFTILSTFPNI